MTDDSPEEPTSKTELRAAYAELDPQQYHLDEFRDLDLEDFVSEATLD